MPSKPTSHEVEIGAAAAAAAAVAAAAPAWRQFAFFESSPIRDANDFARSPAAFRSPNHVAAVCTCVVRPPVAALVRSDADLTDDAVASTSAPTTTTATSSQRSKQKQPSILLGTIQGAIKVLDPVTYAELASWDAFSSSGVAGRVTHLSTDARGRVISLGEEDSSRFPILRIWDIRSGRRANPSQFTVWIPRLLAEGKVQHGSRPHPIAAVSHTPSLSFFSVALADGTVLLIRGLDTALMSASGVAGIAAQGSNARPSPAVALPKFKVVFQPSANESGAHEPVTALGFSENAPPPALDSASLQPSQRHVTHLDPRNLHGSKGRKGPLPRQRDPRAAQRNADAAAAASQDAAPTSVHLFIVTLSRVLRYIVVGKGAGGSPAILDDVGSALGCAAIIPHRPSLSPPSSTSTSSGPNSAGKMVIARDEAIYVIGQEGREACFAYEGPKSSIRLSGSQVIIVTPPFAPSASSTSATVRNFVNSRESNATPSRSSPIGTPTSRKGSHMPTEIAKIAIFDLENKLVAFSGTFESGVREAWVGTHGEILVLSDTGELTRLDEKPLRAKLDVLYRKSLFLLAVNLARSHAERAVTPDAAAAVESLMGDIYQRYGDHLYNKGDYDGAMAQYVKTIGYTQPSFVIRKFLDAQRITNLTTYLQELHSRNLASSDHTTLLLNCYTKLKDVASLDRFIKRPHTRSRSLEEKAADEGLDGLDGAGDDRDDLPFDLETAIRVCRQAGYFSHAAYLAKRYGEHREYLRIQIEDANDHSDALRYVRGLDAEEATSTMTQYAKTLLDHLPEETTDFLIELCSGAFRSTPDQQQSLLQMAQKDHEEGRAKSAAAAYLSYLQVGGFGAQEAASGTAMGNGNGFGNGTSTPARPGGVAAGTSQRNSTVANAEPYTIEGNSQQQQRPTSALAGEDSRTTDGEKGRHGEQRDQGQETDTMQAYLVPSPKTFFAHFIEHPTQFIRFLETVALARWGQVVDMDSSSSTDNSDPAPAYAEQDFTQADGDNSRGHDGQEGDGDDDDEVAKALRDLGLDTNGMSTADADDYEDQNTQDQKSIWNTLLELYLTSESEGKIGDREKAFRLLQQHSTLPYDISHAMTLCSILGFTKGLILLYERLGMYDDIVRFYIDAAGSAIALQQNQVGSNGASTSEDRDLLASSATREVLNSLKKYGNQRPFLYTTVLRFLVSSLWLVSNYGNEMMEILDRVWKLQILSTLEIVQILSSTGNVAVGMVREFITDCISCDQRSLEEDLHQIQEYKVESADRIGQLEKLAAGGGGGGQGREGEEIVFQNNKCNACQSNLMDSFPVIHFMCKHSYHEKCLLDSPQSNSGGGGNECPDCATRFGILRDIRSRNLLALQESLPSTTDSTGANDGLLNHVLHKNTTPDANHNGAAEADAFNTLASLFGKGFMGLATSAQIT